MGQGTPRQLPRASAAPEPVLECWPKPSLDTLPSYVWRISHINAEAGDRSPPPPPPSATTTSTAAINATRGAPWQNNDG